MNNQLCLRKKLIITSLFADIVYLLGEPRTPVRTPKRRNAKQEKLEVNVKDVKPKLKTNTMFKKGGHQEEDGGGGGMCHAT